MAFAGTGKIWMNGSLVDWADAKIHIAAHVVHYGSGVFDGARCYSTPSGSACFRHLALIKMDAICDGYGEGIALDSFGYVSEGRGENIFLVRNEVIYTPPLTASILPGITRDSVITLAQALGYAVREQMVPRELLYIADEVFFAGTAVEITAVRSVDKLQVGNARRGPATEALQPAFF